MCTHGRFVTNKYTRSRFYVTCGKCEACLQQKAAARSGRIRSEYDGETPVYFITLTFDRLSVPYFTRDDLVLLKQGKIHGLKIYRNSEIKWSVNSQKYVRSYKKVCLGDFFIDTSSLSGDDWKCKDLRKQPGKIGVCWFKDIQDFEKRLRQYLKRSGYEEKIKVFNCTEYGETTERPHAHILLFAPNSTLAQIHSAVIACWKYGRRIRDEKSCQLVKDDPAGYVSSYVNGNVSVSPFPARYFAAKHSASKYFGHGRRSFALQEIQKKVSEGSLTYDLERTVDGVPTVLNLPIPKYVVNRFFPLFKGYSRLASNQVYEFLSRNLDVGYLARQSKAYDLQNEATKIDYQSYKILEVSPGKFTKVPGDLKKIAVRFRHAFDYYCQVFPGSSWMDYARSYEAVWRCYKSTCYKKFMEDPDINPFYKYDNICELPPDQQRVLYDQLGNGCVFIVDNNEKPQNVAQTLKMTKMFYKYKKQKKITNLILSESGVPV